MKLILGTTLMAMVTVSCGTANVNRIFGSTDNSTSALLDRAQLAYDRADFDLAEELAKKAYDSTENNGDAAVLLGDVMLSKAGIDIFQLIGKMSELSSSKKTTTTTTDSCTSGSTDAAGTLSTMSCKILSLSTADIAALGEDVPLTSSYFSPVTSYYKPKDITDAVRAAVNVLKHTDAGIRYLCPFISRTKVLDASVDERHAATTCADKTSTSYNSAKANITFGLLHFIETLVYQRSILVDGIASTSGGKSGISTLSSKVNAANFGTDISGFVTAIDEFKAVVDAVANTTNNKSQITLALDGLSVVAACFGEAGVPAKIVSTVTSGLAKIKETASKLATAAGGVTNSSYQTQALKGQINQKYASNIASKMNTVCGNNGDGCSAAQKTQLCTSYTSIAQGVDPASGSKPSWCP